MDSLSIVVPFFDEEKRIERFTQVIKEFLSHAPPYFVELILVDDGSKDTTLEQLSQIKQALLLEFDPAYLAIRTHSYTPNRGKGYALKQGVLRSKGQWVLTMDADGATHPLEMERWLIKGLVKDPHSVYLGSREHPESRVQDHPHRRVLGRVFNALIRLLTSLRLHDTQCGFKLYPGPIAREVFSKLKETGWSHDVELLMRLKRREIMAIELPIRWEAIDESKVRPLKDSFGMLIELIKLRIRLIREGNLKKRALKNGMTLAIFCLSFWPDLPPTPFY